MWHRAIQLKNKMIQVRVEVLIFLTTITTGTLFTWYVYSIELTKIFIDQNSHLNISRLITDSLTPGISQIGFWPPFVHILMAPFSMITPLFERGLSGAFVLVPILGIGAVLLYRLLLVITQNKTISVGGALLFISNPYILYFTATPMTEVLFLTFLFGVAYFLLIWFSTQTFSSLMYLALFIVLASLTRFEGFILIPVVGFFVLLKLFFERKQYHEIEASVILFSLVAGIGVMFVFIYGWIFGDNPLEFLNGAWSAEAQQRDYFLPTAHKLGESIQYFLHASYYMVGKAPLILSAISFFAALSIIRDKYLYFSFISVSMVLLSPTIFDLLALYQGSAVMYVPELPPFSGFFNNRYALNLLGFTIFTTMTFSAFLYKCACTQKTFWLQDSLVAGMAVGALTTGSTLLLYDVVYENPFYTITEEWQTAPHAAKDQKELAEVLVERYDGGKILITRARHDYMTTRTGIHLKNYILESNFQYYEHALDMPWAFARWVVMYNPSLEAYTWTKTQERVSVRWGDSEEFLEMYELIFENNSERLYLLKDAAVRKKAAEYGLVPTTLPSLNIHMVRWDSETLYNDIKAKITTKAAES